MNAPSSSSSFDTTTTTVEAAAALLMTVAVYREKSKKTRGWNYLQTVIRKCHTAIKIDRIRFLLVLAQFFSNKDNDPTPMLWYWILKELETRSFKNFNDTGFIIIIFSSSTPQQNFPWSI